MTTHRLDPARIASFESEFRERRRAVQLIRVLSERFGAYAADPWKPSTGDGYAGTEISVQVRAAPFELPETWSPGNYWAELPTNPFAWAFEEEIERRYATLLREHALRQGALPIAQSWKAIEQRLPDLLHDVPNANVLILAGDVDQTVRGRLRLEEYDWWHMFVKTNDPIYQHPRVIGMTEVGGLIAIWIRDEGLSPAVWVVDWSRFARLTVRPMPDVDGDYREQLVRVERAKSDPFEDEVSIILREYAVLEVQEQSASAGYLLETPVDADSEIPSDPFDEPA